MLPLQAGGGTGLATLHLGNQLRAASEEAPWCRLHWEIVHLDTSRNALSIASALIHEHGLQKQIRFVRASILSLSGAEGGVDLGGPFDYINAVGVLHHLPDPSKGRRQLQSFGGGRAC